MDQQEAIAQMQQMQQKIMEEQKKMNGLIQTISQQQLQSGDNPGREAPTPGNTQQDMPEEQTQQVREMMALIEDVREKLDLIAQSQNETIRKLNSQI